MHGHLPRRQPQIQCDNRAFARGVLLNGAFQVDQLWTKDLQPLLDLSGPVLHFLVYIGSSLKLVADVDIHACLGGGRRSREALLETDFTPREPSKRKEIRTIPGGSGREFFVFQYNKKNCPKYQKSEQLL